MISTQIQLIQLIGYGDFSEEDAAVFNDNLMKECGLKIIEMCLETHDGSYYYIKLGNDIFQCWHFDIMYAKIIDPKIA